MTVIDITTYIPSLGAPFESGVNKGVIKATPWAGDHAASELDGPVFVAPVTLRVPFENSVVAVPFDLEPTTSEFCWRIIMEFHQPRYREIRYVTVPATGPVPFESLTVVDPETFVPIPQNAAAWEAALAAHPVSNGTILSIVAMTQPEFDASTPSPQQLTFIVP